MNPSLIFDSTCLSHFARAGRLPALESLVDPFRCIAPVEVRIEIRAGTAAIPALADVLTAGWLESVELSETRELSAFARYKTLLGGGSRENTGETAVLAWAGVHGDVAIIDERAASRIAQRDGITLESALSLLATQARRLAWPGPASDAPGVSCKRKDILRLSLDEYQKWADAAEEGFDWAATFLAQEGIFTASDVPYRTQLVPLAAIRATIGDEIDNLGIFNRIRQWYWSGVLGELYGGAIETRFARDLEQVVEWVTDDRPPPGTVSAASFNSSRLLTLRTRNSAAYKGIYALLMREGCLDWQKHKPITLASFFDYRIDIHHIFPKAWCTKAENDVDPARRESIVNKTAISFDTNRSIGGRPPSEYLPTLQKKASVSAERLDGILESHRIDPVALRNDDFDAFFDDRKRRILDLIGLAMRKPAIADDEHAEREMDLFEDEPEELEDLPDMLDTDD